MDRKVDGYPDRNEVRNYLQPPLRSVLAAMIPAEEKLNGVRIGFIE